MRTLFFPDQINYGLVEIKIISYLNAENFAGNTKIMIEGTQKRLTRDFQNSQNLED